MIVQCTWNLIESNETCFSNNNQQQILTCHVLKRYIECNSYTWSFEKSLYQVKVLWGDLYSLFSKKNPWISLAKNWLFVDENTLKELTSNPWTRNKFKWSNFRGPEKKNLFNFTLVKGLAISSNKMHFFLSEQR